MFKQAVKSQSKLRMTIDGPAGSGKTYTALRFAHAIARQSGGKIAVIDTERGSASKYVGESPDGYPWQFDVLELTTFSPEKYTEAVIAAGRAGYAVLVIDSLSHAWEGTGGALEIKDRVSSASSENSYTAWRHVTPLHNRMIDTILQAPMHVITTMRSRTEYVPEAGPNGKITNIRRVGLAPVQRPGMEYEFDLVCDMDWSHIMTVGKSRCSAVADARLEKPGAEFVAALLDWLSGAAVEPAQFAPATPATPAAPVEAAPVAAAEENVWTLEKLLTLYSPDLIMQANEGKIPATQEEINTVAMFLAQ